MKNPNPKIFIVDDELLLSEMLTGYLQEQNPDYDIHSFGTGEDCLLHLDENPDFVILDYYLNTKEKSAANGMDILMEIKKRNINIPVAMLSSQESYGIAAKTIMSGAVYYVIKGQAAFDEIYKLIKANI